MPWVSSSISSRVEIRVPENLASNLAPKSYRFNSSTVISWMAPLPSDIRSMVPSWLSTNTLSRVRWMSFSKPSAPISIARRKAGRVFSGA